MSPTPSLPAMIGPTENALRALLTHTLSVTAIRTYRMWVFMNAASSTDPAISRRAMVERVADALKIDSAAAEEVAGELRTAGLLTEDDTLTETGATELATARSAVGVITARLTSGISEDDQETACVVLDRVRGNAEELLRVAQREVGAASRDGSLR